MKIAILTPPNLKIKLQKVPFISPLRRDLLVSLLGHFAIIAMIIIVNPSTGLFHSQVPVMTVNLGDFQTAGGSKKSEQANLPAPIKPFGDETVKEDFNLKTSNKLEKLSKEESKKETKPMEKASGVKSDGKGGIDVTTKVGAGTGSGENIGGINLPYDVDLVEKIIEREWRNPVTSPTVISCTIYFQISRDGTLISEPVVEKSSGISVFDQSAILAIKRAGQFPPFPYNFEYDYIGLHLEFEYAP